MRTLRKHQGVQDLFAPLETHEEEHPVTDAFDFLLSITRCSPSRQSTPERVIIGLRSRSDLRGLLVLSFPLFIFLSCSLFAVFPLLLLHAVRSTAAKAERLENRRGTVLKQSSARNVVRRGARTNR